MECAKHLDKSNIKLEQKIAQNLNYIRTSIN